MTPKIGILISLPNGQHLRARAASLPEARELTKDADRALIWEAGIGENILHEFTGIPQDHAEMLAAQPVPRATDEFPRTDDIFTRTEFCAALPVINRHETAGHTPPRSRRRNKGEVTIIKYDAHGNETSRELLRGGRRKPKPQAEPTPTTLLL